MAAVLAASAEAPLNSTNGQGGSPDRSSCGVVHQRSRLRGDQHDS